MRAFVVMALVCIVIGFLLSRCDLPELTHCTVDGNGNEYCQ